jgi:acyl-coenzyme A thioesterase PaaI-like protein
MAGLDIRAHSICTRVTRSIAFVRCTAYQESQEDPVATAAACFMIGASQTSLLTDWPKDPFPTLDAPDEPAGPFANSPFARCLGIRLQDDGTLMMPFSPKIIGNPILPAIHGGMTGSFLETTAIVGVTRELSAAAPPKPIGLTINYLRPGRALDSYANVSIVKQGRRIVAFEARPRTHPGGGPFSFLAANFYHRGRGSPPGQRMNDFLRRKTSHAAQWLCRTLT